MSQVQSDQTQIEQLIGKYIDGINQSNVDAIVPLFATDGVLMAVDAPTMAGAEQIRALFHQAFGAVKLSAQIFFDEIVVSEIHAYARTHSQVSVTSLQDNMTQNEENRELFLLRKDDGEWKIARYMFNKMPLEK